MLRERQSKSSTVAEVKRIVAEIKQQGDSRALQGMARFGIETSNAYGVSIPRLRAMAKKTGANHDLALELWNTGIHEARILAGMIDDPSQVTSNQMDEWASKFDSWDVVDQCCGNLFDKTPFATVKAREWASRNREFEKRAGFVLMAGLAVHSKTTNDGTFLRFLPVIIKEASDDRNFVKKAANWALRQIGKRNLRLNTAAIRAANQIQRIDSRAAKWIASDALRELTGVSVQNRLKELSNKRRRKDRHS